MKVPTKYDWSQLIDCTASYLEDIDMDVDFYIAKIDNESKKLKGAIDWSWEIFSDADGQPKAVYWDDATEEEREMLDYFAKFEYAKQDVLVKLEQALNLIQRSKEIMEGIAK